MIAGLVDTAADAVSGGTPLAVLFPVNMGNRGQNMLSVRDTFLKLAGRSEHVQFVAYHPRISGNFVFRYTDEKTLREAVELGERMTGLACLARSFEDLMRANAAVPGDAEVVRDSVVLETPAGPKRMIFVALSERISAKDQVRGPVRRRIEILSWPSEQDILCVYDRPGQGGDVGQVTGAVVTKVRKLGGYGTLYGTGRGVRVIQDLLTGRRLRR